MAGTNSDTTVVDDDKEVTEQDLRDLKYPADEVETPSGEDETSEGDETEDAAEGTGEDDGQTDDQTEDEGSEDDSTDDSAEEASEFVKEFDYIKGDTPEEYARNLEKAYQNSTAEALRLKRELEAPSTAPATETPDTGTETGEGQEQAPLTSALELYAKQQMDKDITQAFAKFQVDYPQVAEQTNYDQFTRRVAILSKTILDSENRLAEPAELYSLSAVSLGWEKTDSTPDDKDKLAMAAKDKAATGRQGSTPGARPKGSKVSEAMIAANLKMYPGKTRDEIIKELEPHIS